MSIFDLIINLVEGIILSSFIAYYFDLKRKNIFILLVSAICFIQISLSNYYNNFDQLLLNFLMFTLLISLWIEKKEKHLEDIIICFLAGIMLLISNLIALTCSSLIFNIEINQIYINGSLLVFSIILSKIIFAFLSVLLCIFKVRVHVKLPIQNWWMIAILGLSIVFVLAVLMRVFLMNVFTSGIEIILILSVVLISILFILIFRKIQIENCEKMKYALKIQKNQFNEENYKRTKVMSDQIAVAEHRMMYILMQIKNCINNGDYVNASIITDQYIKKVKSFETIITTNNPYFDFVISRKVSELRFEDMYIKNIIFISENDIYNTKSFCDLIVLAIDHFKDSLDEKKELSLSINQENDFVIIEIAGKLCVNFFDITDEIYNNISLFNGNYSLVNIDNIFKLKIAIELQFYKY